MQNYSLEKKSEYSDVLKGFVVLNFQNSESDLFLLLDLLNGTVQIAFSQHQNGGKKTNCASVFLNFLDFLKNLIFFALIRNTFLIPKKKKNDCPPNA